MTEPGSEGGWSRRRLLQAGGAVVGAAALAATLDRLLVGPAVGSPWDPGRGSGPVFGMLQAEPGQYGALADAGVTAVTLSVSWSQAQPEPGALDEGYLADVERRHRLARASGLDLALSLGLQYPPRWVAERPDARFVDQHGRTWRGPTGDDVVDGVFDERVRQAQDAYLAALGSRLSGLELAGVRVGGLARGELHYPPVDRTGVRNTLWAYGRSAQRACPVPGWRPGQGSPDDAQAFLDWYLGALTDYGRWQLEAVRRQVSTTARLLVLLPSWGLRPGEVEQAVAAGLDGSTPGERRGTLSEGLDWQRQLAACAQVPGVDVCSTWLDPEDQGDDPSWTSPARYLAGLAAPQGLGVWGENTGGNDAEELRRCLSRVRELPLRGLFWMGGSDLGVGRNATLDDYARAIAGADRGGAMAGAARPTGGARPAHDAAARRAS